MSLVLRDIRHSFGSTVVIDGASIEASPGEIVCLFGPSGCGKTTLLRIAAGLEVLQEGAVELGGATLATPHLATPPERRQIGFVFQDYVLFPHLSVARNIAFGLNGLDAAARDARIERELTAVNLWDFRDSFPHQLSGGQQQRAALARAFARQPNAMLLDEPFASIDVALRQRVRGEMRGLLKSRSTPTILVTHDPAEAIELGDRIAIMDKGRIVEAASSEMLFRAPKTLAAATLFPGSQSLACRPIDGGVETAFGELKPLVRPANAAFVAIHAGGISAVEDAGGRCRAVDCRFEGPGWLATVCPEGRPGPTVRAACAAAVEIGGAVTISVDLTKTRALAS
jgi:iron(III) transport system ATP-binding protein